MGTKETELMYGFVASAGQCMVDMTVQSVTHFTVVCDVPMLSLYRACAPFVLLTVST